MGSGAEGLGVFGPEAEGRARHSYSCLQGGCSEEGMDSFLR